MLARKTLTRCFSSFLNGFSTERPAQDRVVSTPEWPVPYYNRKFRAYPSQDVSVDYTSHGAEICEGVAYTAKELLNQTQAGRDVVSYVEDNVQLDGTLTNRYLTLFRLCHDPEGLRKNGQGLRC